MDMSLLFFQFQQSLLVVCRPARISTTAGGSSSMASHTAGLSTHGVLLAAVAALVLARLCSIAM
jgi:hypothetical protein